MAHAQHAAHFDVLAEAGDVLRKELLEVALRSLRARNLDDRRALPPRFSSCCRGLRGSFRSRRCCCGRLERPLALQAKAWSLSGRTVHGTWDRARRFLRLVHRDVGALVAVFETSQVNEKLKVCRKPLANQLLEQVFAGLQRRHVRSKTLVLAGRIRQLQGVLTEEVALLQGGIVRQVVRRERHDRGLAETVPVHSSALLTQGSGAPPLPAATCLVAPREDMRPASTVVSLLVRVSPRTHEGIAVLGGRLPALALARPSPGAPGGLHRLEEQFLLSIEEAGQHL
mmetsp:Transcript_158/g.674  ORF Transcript_158/g.674 Transcript_158/m.674 type:complete len:284 (-) Transcript_158:244-1095(-)